MDAAGIWPTTRLDFDFAVVSWWDQFEQFQHERVKGPDPSPKLGKNQAMVPKYDTLEEIFQQFEMADRDKIAERINPEHLLAAIEAEEDIDPLF